MEDGNMQTDQLRKHLQLFTEGIPVPDEDLPGPAPAPAAAPAAGTDMASRLRAATPYDGDDPELKNVKMVPLTAQEERKFQDLFKRMDAILLKYKDIKKKPFESVDVDSMTESEQHQYIMQNLHLLSEADQMVILRSITTESKVKMAGDIIKYGIDKAGNAIKYGIEKVATPIIGGIWSGVARPVLKFGAVGVTAVGGGAFLWNNWDELFPSNPAIDRLLSPEDKAEWYRLGDEAQFGILAELPDGYRYAYSTDLTEKMNSLKVRWEKILAASEERRRSEAGTATPGPGMIDQAKDAYDKVNGMFNK
jgi:hypothetical protein